MSEDYRPSYWHVLVCIVFAGLAAMIPAKVLQGWQPVVVGAMMVLALLDLFLLVHYSVTSNIDRLRTSARDLIESVRDVDDSRLRTIGVHFPEWHIKPIEEGERVAFMLEDTSITREFFIKILTHNETNNVQIAPVRSFPQRQGQQLMAAEFHKLAHRRGWAEEWGGSTTSKWKLGWAAARLLNLYGCDDVIHLADLNQVETSMMIQEIN